MSSLSRQPSRRAILREHGILEGDRGAQALFWRQYNASRGRRRRPSVLGDLAARVVREVVQSEGPLSRVRELWERVLPTPWSAACEVESLVAGRLTVSVDGAATRYVMQRQWAPRLLEAINAEFGSGVVRRIEFRVTGRRSTYTPG